MNGPRVSPALTPCSTARGTVALCATAMLGLAACQTPLRTAPGAAPAVAATESIDALAADIEADADRSDHENDAKARAVLADDARRKADACLAQAPRAAACLYGDGIAFGLEARARPVRATEFLTNMQESLRRAEAADAGYDEAGPARVRALLLIRAPGWPVGPGDPEAGLAAAQRAAALRPDYPPNVLAVGEALSKTGDRAGAHRSYARARTLAEAREPSPQREEWLRQADEGLKHNP